VEDFAQYASAECLSIRHDLVEQGHLKDAKASCANLLRIYDRYEQRSSSADIRSELEPVRHQIQSLQEDIINQTGGSEKKSFQELSLEQKIPVIDRLMQQKRPGVLLPLLLETLTKERRWQRAEKKDMGRKAVEPELEETLDPAHQEIKVPWELSVHFGAASKPWQDLDFTLWAIKENAAVDVSLYGQFLPHEQLKEEIRRRMPGFLPPELHDATEAYIEWFVKAMRARSTAEKWAQVAKRDFQKRKEKEKYVQAA
jgi:hypothetical protein